MNAKKLAQEWIDIAPNWIRESREGTNSNRVGLLDNPLIRLCDPVKGLRAIDLGCGEGRFSRMLSSRGAKYVLGVDLCGPMIEAANEIHMNGVEFRVGDVQHMPWLTDDSFDLAVSYLNQCDLPDFVSNVTEVHRILRPGGKFVIANLHPMRSAVGHWLKDKEGHKEHVILDDYFQEGERSWKMMGVKFTNFHRTLESYISAFIQAGFSIKNIIEPAVTSQNLEKYPELNDELRGPNFIVFGLVKL